VLMIVSACAADCSDQQHDRQYCYLRMPRAIFHFTPTIAARAVIVDELNLCATRRPSFN
jgi:hypothetical protein